MKYVSGTLRNGMSLIEEYCSSESYHFTEQVEEGILGSTVVFTTVINFELILPFPLLCRSRRGQLKWFQSLVEDIVDSVVSSEVASMLSCCRTN